MEPLRHEFIVRQNISKAFAILVDLERIAPCLPGATLEGRDGDDFIGGVKVKLGAIVANFHGRVRITNMDSSQFLVSLEAKGREKGGRGSAEATIFAKLEPVTTDECRVVVETELKIMGKIAQFGRGIIADVSRHLIDQFAENLDNVMSVSTSPEADAPVPEASDESVLELGSVMSRVLVRRLAPIVAVVVAIAAALMLIL